MGGSPGLGKDRCRALHAEPSPLTAPTTPTPMEGITKNIPNDTNPFPTVQAPMSAQWADSCWGKTEAQVLEGATGTGKGALVEHPYLAAWEPGVGGP